VARTGACLWYLDAALAAAEHTDGRAEDRQGVTLRATGHHLNHYSKVKIKKVSYCTSSARCCQHHKQPDTNKRKSTLNNKWIIRVHTKPKPKAQHLLSTSNSCTTSHNKQKPLTDESAKSTQQLKTNTTTYIKQQREIKENHPKQEHTQDKATNWNQNQQPNAQHHAININLMHNHA
jgi:hypothetical protein